MQIGTLLLLAEIHIKNTNFIYISRQPHKTRKIGSDARNKRLDGYPAG